MPNNKKTIKRLLNLSQLIVDEFEVFASLSYHDQEQTSQFDDHIHTLKNYLDSEQVILNNLSFSNLVDLFNELQAYDDGTDAFDRCFIIVDEKLNKYLDSMEEASEEEKMEALAETDLSIDEDKTKEEKIDYYLEKYYIEEEETEKYALHVIDNIATVVIKKMLKRIYDTITDNKKDDKYKKTLIKAFKKFKYFYFSLDNQLEHVGVSYKFNVDKIPMPFPFNFDTSKIFYNQCVTILDKLYAEKKIDYTPTKMEEMLFNIMMLEEYLAEITDESLDRLTELTDELEVKYGHNYFGNLGKQKVLSKKN